MKRLDFHNPTKHKAPKQCQTCGQNGCVDRVALDDDRIELFNMKRKSQNRVRINGRWTIIAKVSTITHYCNTCKARTVVWRDVQRKSEKGSVLSRLITYRV